MKKNGFIIILLLVVAAAAVLSILLFFHGDGGGVTPAPAPVTDAPTSPPLISRKPETLPSAAPMETPEPAPTPEPTPSPEPTPEETEEPEPTETPEPEPTPLPDSSGSFASDTGTWLNLLADWTAYTDESGQRKLRVDLTATHYSLQVDGYAKALVLTVDGRSYTADSPAIDYAGAEIAATPLHTFVVDAPAGNVTIEAVWRFHGSYSGTVLDTITASGTAFLG